MKRTIGLFSSGAIALGLISLQCSSGSDDDTNTTAGTGVGGSPIVGGAVAAGGGGASAGLPGVSGGDTGTFGGSPPGGAPGGGGPAGAPNSGGQAGGAGFGGAPVGVGGTSGSGTGGTTGGGGASAGSSGSGTGGGASGASSGGSGGGSAGGGSTSTVKFSDVATILNSACAGALCHGAGQNNHNVLANNSGLYMRLTTPMTVGDCKQTTLVTANDPNSFLVKVINDRQTCGSNSINKMPKTGTLSAAQIKTITDWVTEGAKQ